MTERAVREAKAICAALEDREALQRGPIFIERDGQTEAVLLSIERYWELAGETEREDWAERELAPLMPEIGAYQKMLPELLEKHRGQWVAIHQGRVVGSARSRPEVARLVIEKQYRPVYIERVQDEERMADIPHLERTDDARV